MSFKGFSENSSLLKNSNNSKKLLQDKKKFSMTTKGVDRSIDQSIDNSLQGKAADNVVDVLAVMGEGSRGFGKTTESRPQHLQLGKRNLPVTCVFLNQLLGRNTYT